MRANNRVFSFILAIALCLNLCTSALAFDAKEINAQRGSDNSRLCFDGAEEVAIADSEILQYANTSPVNISLDFKDSENVVVSIHGEDFDISENGQLYVYDEGLNSGKRVVFVPSAQDKIGVMRFNRDEGALRAKIGNNLKSADVTAQVSESDFEALYAKGVEAKEAMIGKGEYNRLDYLAKLIEADLGFVASNNPISGQTSANEVTAYAYTKPTYLNLKNFLRALSDRPNAWISISDYGISDAYLTTEEFTLYNEGTKCFCSKKTNYISTDGYYYTRIGILDLVYNVIPATTGYRTHKMDASIINGVMLQYDATQKKARLYVDDFSPIFYNIQPALAMKAGNENNIFISNEISGQVRKTSVDVLSLLSLAPKYGWIPAVFSSLRNDSTSAFTSGERIYRATVDEQITTYGGAIREVSFNGQKAYLCYEGDHILMTAQEKYTSTPSTLHYAWKVLTTLNADELLF